MHILISEEVPGRAFALFCAEIDDHDSLNFVVLTEHMDDEWDVWVYAIAATSSGARMIIASW